MRQRPLCAHPDWLILLFQQFVTRTPSVTCDFGGFIISVHLPEISNFDPTTWSSPAQSETLVKIRWHLFHAIHTRELGARIRPVAEVKYQARSTVEQLSNY